MNSESLMRLRFVVVDRLSGCVYRDAYVIRCEYAGYSYDSGIGSMKMEVQWTTDTSGSLGRYPRLDGRSAEDFCRSAEFFTRGEDIFHSERISNCGNLSLFTEDEYKMKFESGDRETDNEMMLELRDGERGWLRVGGWGATQFITVRLPKRANWGEAPVYARHEVGGQARIRAKRQPGYESREDPWLDTGGGQDGEWDQFKFCTQGFVRSWVWTPSGKIKCDVAVRATSIETGRKIEDCPDAVLEGKRVEEIIANRYGDERNKDLAIVEIERDPADVGWDVGQQPEAAKAITKVADFMSTKSALVKAGREGVKIGVMTGFTAACTNGLMKFLIKQGLPKKFIKAKWLAPFLALVSLALVRVMFVHLEKTEAVRVADKALELEVAKMTESAINLIFSDVLPLALEVAKSMADDDGDSQSAA